MAFSERFEIAGRLVGPGAPVLIIAEAGVAHFGDSGKARELIDLAAESGADVFKTQAFNTNELISSRLTEWRDRMRPKEVSFEFIEQMKARCDEKDILFMCTAHDKTGLDWVDRLDVPAYKIGSGERDNTSFFEQIAERKKPVVMSTGMHMITHVQNGLAAFSKAGCTELGLLHCITSYPTPVDQVNLRAMDVLKNMFSGPVGYSDHTETHDAVLAAVARGAAIIEKHITLDFNVPDAQDWKVSCGPDDFSNLIASIRQVERLLGKAVKSVQHCEEASLNWALKSLVAARDLPAGTVLSEDDIVSKRPGDGLSPFHENGLLGRQLHRTVKRDDLITLDNLR